MKITLSLFLLTFNTNAQDTLIFNDGIILEVSIIEFKIEKNKIETCYYQNQPYYCKINGKEWFGSDIGIELPKYQLERINVKYNNRSWLLDVSQMYNPILGLEIDNRHFNVKLLNNEVIEIYGWFSDGAGTYCAKWIIENNTSKRILLSKNEKDCFN